MLGPAVTSALSFLRRQAESMQDGACVITRAGQGAPAFDAETGISSGPPPDKVYAGAFRLRSDPAMTRADAGEHDFTLQQYVMSIPASAPTVKVDDVVTITRSPHAPDLVDRTFVVAAIAAGSQQTARRFLVQEVTS